MEHRKSPVHIPIGREALLARLQERYLKAACADGGAVLLRGGAGIGKSRILESFASSIAPSDPNLFVTPALDYASSPFAPIAYVIETWLQTRAELFDLHPGLREAVARLLAADVAGIAPSAGERRRCFDSVARLFRLAAADAPTTLVIDDLHNADVATLHLLYHIVAATSRSAFLLVAAYRSGPLRLAVADEIARLELLDNVACEVVGPIEAEKFEEVVRGMGAGRIAKGVIARILERAEGNPLFARELVRQSSSNPTDARVPDSIAKTILDRYLALDDDERELLSLASAFGREFESIAIARTLGQTAEVVHARLRAAARAGLIDETPDPHVFRFHHALTREAIYGDLLEVQRRAVHRKIFEELQLAGKSVKSLGALAFHAHAWGDRETTAYYNELAGDSATASQAFEAAVEFYERAASALAPAGADSTRVAMKLASAYLVAGLPDRATAPAAAALSYLRARGDLAGIVEALLLLAEVAGQIGEDELRLERLSEVRSLLADTTDPGLIAKRSLCESEISLAERNTQRVIDSCTFAMSASPIDSADALALHNAHAHALLLQRRYREAILTQASAVRYASKYGNSEQLSLARFSLGAVLALSGEIARASVAFVRAARVAETRWATTERSLSLAVAAEMELMRGQVARATDYLVDALPDARRSDHPGVVVALGRVGLFLGLRTADTSLLESVVEMLDLEALFRERTPAQYFPLSGAFAQYLVSIGRDGEATEILQRAVRRLSIKRLRSTDWSVCSMLTVAELGSENDLAAARRPIAEWFAPYAPAFLHLFDAIVAARTGDLVAMARHGEAGAIDFRRFGLAFEEGVSLEFAGRKHEALAVMEASGFRADVARLREELTPRNRRGRASGTLTARENDVAQLVAERLTNREIADRLFVSEKTVETHLASIFSKLGIASRAQVGERIHTARAGV